MHDITVVILTYNEQIHIERAIASAKKIANRIVVVDSFSSDKTKEICLSLDVDFYQNPFVNQAVQFDWAIENCGIETAWIFRLDADEYLEDSLVHEINSKLSKIPVDVNGVLIRRKHFFLGRWIRFGGRFPLTLLRLFRTGKARVEIRWMDEHIVLKEGRSVRFSGCFVDDNKNEVSWFLDKHINYSKRELVDRLCTGHGSLEGHNFSSRVKRFIKTRIYSSMPRGGGPLLYFIYRYIFLFGFLDGFPGLAYHVLQGFWYRLLVDIRIYEFDKVCCDNPNVDKYVLLEQYTKLKINEK